MALLKTCLLVSDDPDDHQIISEALKEIAPDLIVLVLMDCAPMLELLDKQKLSPDHIIFDLDMNGMDENLVKRINTHSTKDSMIAYSEDGSSSAGSIPVFTKRMSFTEVREWLKKFLA